MSDSNHDVVLALLAELEAQAKRKGKKSILKGVMRRLRVKGGSEQLLTEMAALSGGKTIAAAPPEAEAQPKAPKKRSAPVKSPSKPTIKAKAALKSKPRSTDNALNA